MRLRWGRGSWARAGRISLPFAVLAGIPGSGCGGRPVEPGSGAEIVAVSVHPRQLAMAARDSARFTAHAVDEAGDSALIAAVWTAGGGTISAGGVFRPDSTAAAHWVAAAHPERPWLSDTATVTLTTPTALALHVKPRDPVLAVGDTVEFSAYVMYAAGDSSLAAASWSADGGTLTAAGPGRVRFSSGAAGQFDVRATLNALADTTTVTVSAPADVLLNEGFDDGALAARGWYDAAGSATISTTEKRTGAGALQLHWTTGSTGPHGAVRRVFTPTETLYVSYWVKYSSAYVGSGKPYHPHEFGILSSLDGDWDGLTWNYLNTYIEQNYQNGGIPRLVIQDSRMIDITKIGVDLTGVTEQRSVAGCNGNTDGTGVTSCFQVSASEWYNAKEWDAPGVAFRPVPGADYKGDWNHVEVYFRLNSVAGGVGQPDGVVRYWLNGNLKIEHTNVLFRTGANPTLRFRQVLITPYIGDGSPVTQAMWVDDLVLSSGVP
jgi:hypothetical protein